MNASLGGIDRMLVVDKISQTMRYDRVEDPCSNMWAISEGNDPYAPAAYPGIHAMACPGPVPAASPGNGPNACSIFMVRSN
jgi:hypothetical protein